MHLRWGGQPNRILVTSLGLKKRGHRVVLATPKGATLGARGRAAGLEVADNFEMRRGLRLLPLWRDVGRMRTLLEAHSFDIVDTHGSQDTWIVAIARMFLPKEQRPRFVRTRHNIFPIRAHLFHRWLYGQIDHIITISPQVIGHMGGVLPREKFTAIFSAPDGDRFTKIADREATRQALGFTAEHDVVGVVARLAPEKGHEHLVRAMPEILRKRPQTRFVFIGEGRTRPQLEALMAELVPPGTVILTGFREDVPSLLHALDLFVLPCTEGESLGTSILEAFLMEVPVVACDVGGVRESVHEGETGRLVPPANPSALAEAILDQLGNKERGKKWALRGKELVETVFTADRIAEQTEGVYRRVLGEA